MRSKQAGDEEEARIKEDIKLIHSLMMKFNIDPQEEYAYVKLSILLARKLYPNGIKPVGRPKTPVLTKVEKLLEKLLTTNKPGRPATKKDMRRRLLKVVESIKSDQGLEGWGSDKKALEIIVEQLARRNKRSVLATRTKYLSKWQKDLSRARNEQRDS